MDEGFQQSSCLQEHLRHMGHAAAVGHLHSRAQTAAIPQHFNLVNKCLGDVEIMSNSCRKKKKRCRKHVEIVSNTEQPCRNHVEIVSSQVSNNIRTLTLCGHDAVDSHHLQNTSALKQIAPGDSQAMRSTSTSHCCRQTAKTLSLVLLSRLAEICSRF